MRFRLKDRELQKKLDEISNGGLSRMLGRLPYYTTQSSEPDFLHFSKNPHLMLEVTSDMLESLREYNPHAWNKYPEVEPPKDVWMRCENVYGSEPERLERFAARYTSQYEDGEWVDAWFSNGLRRDVTSFRPWDEEDEE